MSDLLYLSYDKDVPANDYWDHAFINHLLENKVWSPVGTTELNYVESINNVGDGAVIVFPARRQSSYVDHLNKDIQRLKWVIIILTGDEAREFPADQISHPNMKLWIMTPNPERHPEGARKIGSGFPPQALEWLSKYKEDAFKKEIDYFFAGQITHERRIEAAKQLEIIDEFKESNKLDGIYLFSSGFTEGMPHKYYYKGLASSKTSPCPSGPESPDSFRLYESLEAGCIPIVDAYSPKLKHDDYWTWFFDEEPPFPVYKELFQIRGYIAESVTQYPQLSNKISSWWQTKKREMCYWLRNDIENLSGTGTRNLAQTKDTITVIIPSSPIPAHPSTEMIEKTIADIRHHLPESEILITVDGIRAEQEHYRTNYEEYKKRLLWLANHEWHNVLPIVFDQHMHQASMAREILKLVETPTILYVEHDTPLTPDRQINWLACVRSILDGTANIIRFSHESKILPEHNHLFFETERHNEISLTKTQQWSQRPHLASTAFYKSVIDNHFHPDSRTMIEDVMHQAVELDMQRGGRQAWFNWRIWMYNNPDADGSILRSYNLDGRQHDEKFDMVIIPMEAGNGRD